MIKRNTNRKLTLEQRIARLERALRKNEGCFANLNRIKDFVVEYVNDELAADYRWEQDDASGTSAEFERAFNRLANNHAPELVDEIMEACADELNIDLDDLEECRDAIADEAAEAAADCLDVYFKYKPESVRRCGRRNVLRR